MVETQLVYIKMVYTPCIRSCKEIAVEVDEDCRVVGKASKSKQALKLRGTKQCCAFIWKKTP